MNKSTIQTLIDKVIGKKGLIRVPSWWMRKVLMQMADWVQEGDDANGEKIVKVKEEADGKIGTLETNTNSKINTLETNTNRKISTLEVNTNSKISALETNNTDNNNFLFELVESAKLPKSIKCFAVKTKSRSGFVIVDGVNKSIPANTKKVISFVTNFRFGTKGGSSNYISHIGFTATDTSAVTDMSYMFYECESLTSLDLSGINTSAVTNMEYMFARCSALTSLNLTGLDASAVTSMFRMFNGCSSLKSLDLSSFGTSALTSMTEMFINCSSLTSINFSGFNTSAVTSMNNTFAACKSLTSLDLTGFDTSKVETMYQMFLNCRSLTSLDLSSFDTSKVTTMAEMFKYCTALTSLILGPNFFKTSYNYVDFSYSTNWTNDTVVTSLVTNSYDRATAGLSTMTLQLSANTKAALTDEQKAAITAKGYTIA